MRQSPSSSLDDRLRELAEACRILDMERQGDKTLGHMSLRDSDGRGMWIKRSGIALGEVHGPQDFILVAFDGKVLSGSGARHAEWPIHSEIYRVRPEIQSIARTHPLNVCIFAATEAPLEPVAREGSYFQGRLPRFRTTSNLVTTPALGIDLAETLDRHMAVLLRNHGVVFCGRSTGECVVAGLMLDRACRAQLALNASGLEWTPARASDQMHPPTGFIPEREILRFWNYYRRKLARRTRSAVPSVAPATTLNAG